MQKLFFMSLLLTSALSAEIKEIHHFSEIETAIGPLKNSDWLLLDIDYTLTEPSDPALQMSVIKQNKLRFREELSKFNAEEKELVPVLMVTQTESQLTDPLIPKLIQKWQKQIPVLGFTALDTSVLPQIGYIPAWRTKELKNLGISFHVDAQTPFPKERVEFNTFPSFRGTFPLYEDGILYCNVTNTKGDVLSAFLKKASQTPSKIIFVDDTLENLESVEAALANYDIPFLGIHYKVPADPTKKVSDAAWRATWDKVLERAHSTDAQEGILQTGDITAINWAIKTMPEDSLIIFDIGNVILTHSDIVLGCKYRTWIKEWLIREGYTFDKEIWRGYSAIIDREAPMELVNLSLPSIIHEAKQYSTVIALSKFWVGPAGANTSFEEQRIDSLNAVGINFGEPFPNAAGWSDPTLEATYAKGLIQTEAPLKGPVLTAFLKLIACKPKAILFVDDRRDQCESIATAAQELGIPVLCVHYTEATDRVLTLNPIIADLQLRTLINEKHWLSDEEALDLIQSREVEAHDRIPLRVKPEMSARQLQDK